MRNAIRPGGTTPPGPTPRTPRPPIVETAPILGELAAWLDAINARDKNAMLATQRRLRADFGISICFIGRKTGNGKAVTQ
jgi:hypothetical protein